MSMRKINRYSTVFEKLNNEINWALLGSILIFRYLSYNLKTQHKIKKIDISNDVIINKLLFSYFVKDMASLQSTKDDEVVANGVFCKTNNNKRARGVADQKL